VAALGERRGSVNGLDGGHNRRYNYFAGDESHFLRPNGSIAWGLCALLPASVSIGVELWR